METMKRFHCGDVVPGCEASWVCSTDEELLARVAEHAAAAHGIQEVSPELVAAVRQHITTA
jgi:predicted small metal-binding protein